MRFGLKIALAGVLYLGLATGSASSGEEEAPSIGAKASAFNLKDQKGKDGSLDELLKKGNVALVFFRSAGW